MRMRRALALEALSSTLVICCRRCCFVVVAIVQRNVLQNEARAPVHERLVDNICCCCSQVVIIVTIARRDMIVSCACTQGLVVCRHFTRRNMKRTRGKLTTYLIVAAVFLLLLLSCDIDMKQKRGLSTTYVAVTATVLLLLPLCNAMLKCRALAHETFSLLPPCDGMCKRTALAQWMVAAQTIFLWRCHCRHLHIQLAHQPLQRQQRKAALTHLQYRQDCCLRAALAEEQR